VANIDFEKMLKFHEEKGARCTALVTRHPIHKERDTPITAYDINEDGQIVGADLACEISEADNMGISTFIMEREDLIGLLSRTAREGKMSFRRDVLLDLIKTDKVMAYEAEESILFIDDLSCYLKSNMEILKQDVRDELFQNQKRPIITRVKDSAPARYGSGSKAVNSIIADGAIIDGEVKNSIIFRGVRVKKGAVVENSVIMQDTTVGEGAHINYAVLDKDVIIQDSRLLSGYITHPFYVGKGTVI
jgi:glucose-1-phosphate adenylyltransferase